MEENKKNELTEELKVLETEVNDLKIDAKAIQRKLNLSYDYETELIERLENCKKKRMELIDDSTKKNKEISIIFDKMKNILDVFTSNFYKH